MKPVEIGLYCFFKTSILLGILALYGDLSESTCDAHSGIFNPIPPPPPSDMVPGQIQPRPNAPVTGTPSMPASPGPKFEGLKGPAGTVAGPAGGATKKIRRVSSNPITWEHWWARNRYRYLDFPGVLDKAGLYPVTPKPVDMREKLEELKARCIERIRPMLDDKAARKRRGALVSLARLGDLESFPRMMEGLKDPNQTVRDAALLALGILERHEAKHTLLHVARGTRTACETLDQSCVPEYLRGYAEISLALENTQGIDRILQNISLDEESPHEVRAMALEAIGLLGGEENAAFLLEFVRDERLPDLLLGAAVSALGKTGEPFVLPHLERCLNADSLPVRQSACLGIGLLGKPNDEDLVRRLYLTFRHTNDQALKGFSLVSIGQIGGDLAVQYLDHVLVKGRKSEQAWACLGLGIALRNADNDRAASHLMQEAMGNSNRSTRGAAAIALGLAGCRKAVNPLIHSLKNEGDPLCRGYTALALGMLGEPSAAGPLRRILAEDKNPQVMAQAAQALALMNDTSSVPAMVELLVESPSDVTKVFAALSLTFVGDLRIAETVLDLMDERELDDLTSLHCARLLSKLLSGQTTPYLERLAAGSNIASEYPLVNSLLEFDL